MASKYPSTVADTVHEEADESQTCLHTHSPPHHYFLCHYMNETLLPAVALDLPDEV